MSVQACVCAAPKRLAQQVGAADSCAIIVAGGSGTRFGNPLGKQFVGLCGLPLVAWSLIAFDRAPSVAQLVLVIEGGREEEVREHVLSRVSLATPVVLATAGETRQESVFSGLRAMDERLALVAVHDGARPLIDVQTIEGCVSCVRDDASLAGAICALPSIDTLKIVEDGVIRATPDRCSYWCAQTPQVFRTRQLVAAHRAAQLDAFGGTDDASLVERCNGRVACVPSPRANIKVTVPEDLLVVRALLETRLMREGCGIDLLDDATGTTTAEDQGSLTEGGSNAAHRTRI